MLPILQCCWQILILVVTFFFHRRSRVISILNQTSANKRGDSLGLSIYCLDLLLWFGVCFLIFIPPLSFAGKVDAIEEINYLHRQLESQRTETAATPSNVSYEDDIKLLEIQFYGLGVLCALTATLLPLVAGIEVFRLWRLAKTNRRLIPPKPPVIVPPVVIYTLYVPQRTTWNSEQALKCMEQLAFSFQPLIFRIHADNRQIAWQIVDVQLGIEPEIIEQTLRTLYPEIEVTIQIVDSTTQSTQANAFQYPFYRYFASYQQFNHFTAPLEYVTALQQPDPLAALTQAINNLRAGEQVIYTLILGSIAADAYAAGEQFVTQSTIHPFHFLSRRGVGEVVGKIAVGNTRTEKFLSRDQKVMEEKLRQRLYRAFFTIQIDSPDFSRIYELLVLVDTQLSHFTWMPFNGVQWVERPLEMDCVHITNAKQAEQGSLLGLYKHWITNPRSLVWKAPTLVLEARELASLWHLPYQGFAASRIKWIPNSQVPIPAALLTHHGKGVYLGIGKFQGRTETVYISEHDRRTHLNIVGKTGMGKSTLIHHLIHQDIQQNEGVALIDPHGTLVKAVLHTSIPKHRERDVVILDLANTAYPPPLNPLRGHQDYVGLGRVVSIIEKLFSGTEQYARLSKYLRASVGLLQVDAQPTMRDLSRVFTDAAYREHLLSQTDDPLVVDTWDEYNLLSPAYQQQIREPVLSRISPFYGNPMLYPILCHPDALNFRQMIADRKIILISLAMPEERVPEQERNIIGALIVSQLQMAGMQQRHTPFYVYIDEVQKFVTTSLSIVLSEARKFGLSLTMANQFLGQLEGQTLEAVMGNVGTTIVFRCSPDDARALAPYTKPQFDLESLVNLDGYQMAVKLQQQGATQPAFTLVSPKPLQVPNSYADRERNLRTLSIQQYTPKPTSEVKSWLKDRYPRYSQQLDSDESTFYE